MLNPQPRHHRANLSRQHQRRSETLVCLRAGRISKRELPPIAMLLERQGRTLRPLSPGVREMLKIEQG